MTHAARRDGRGWATAAFTIVTCAVFLLLFLFLQQLWAVFALLAAGIVIAVVAARCGLLARANAGFADHGRKTSALLVVALLVVAGFFHNAPYPLLMLSTVLLFIAACLGLHIQSGYAGIINFAGAAFFGIGAYTTAVLSAHTAIPHLPVLAAGGVMAALIGSILILPVLRTYGYYEALVTIAFGILFRTFMEVNNTFGGPQGLTLPGLDLFGWSFNNSLSLGGIDISFYMNYLLLSLLLVVGGIAIVLRIERSWVGLNLDAVRLDETAAKAFGISVARWKITAFTLGNLLCGIAGGVYGMMQGFISPASFAFSDSLIMISIIILGGIGNPWGVIPAAAIIIMLPEKLQFIQEYRFLLYGILVILILLFRPQGLMPRRLRAYFPGSEVRE
ncbi:MAG TPA: branched-chain amino acid ABC transporter permease [Gammaproteobacteria bacterium]|nr:branched-chain amino acid ABC transporter permease [Gammaproteobacteria bacterium]